MRLKDWLKKHEMNQSDFASAIGVNKATVSHWLNGKTNPTANTQKKIRKVTNGAVTQEEVCET